MGVWCVGAHGQCLPVLHLCQQIRVCCPECSFSLSGPVWSRHLKGRDMFYIGGISVCVCNTKHLSHC